MKKFCKLIAFVLCLALCVPAAVFTVPAAMNSVSNQTAHYLQPLYVNGVETGALYTQIQTSSGGYYQSACVINAVEVPARSSTVTLEAINCGSYTYSKTNMATAAIAYNNSHPNETVVAAINSSPWHTQETSYGGGYGTVKNYTIPYSLTVIDGEVWNTAMFAEENGLAGSSGTAPIQANFAVTSQGTYVIGSVLTAVPIANNTKGTSFLAGGLNRLPANNAIVVYNHRGGTSQHTYADAYEVYLTASDASFRLGVLTSATVTKVYESGYTGTRDAIGANTIVISARGTAINTIKGQFSVGDSVSFVPQVTGDWVTMQGVDSVWNTPGYIRETVGGFYELYRNGVILGENKATNYPAPIIGIKADGSAVIVSVTSKTEGTRAASQMRYLPYICQELGLVQAIMGDGGGSAQFVTLDGTQYVRRATSSDGAGTTRGVVNGWGVVYHGASISATSNANGSLKLLTKSITPTGNYGGDSGSGSGSGSGATTGTYQNVSVIDTMNGATVNQAALLGAPLTMAMAGSLNGSSLSIKGWSIVNGGTNGDVKYSVDGATWKDTSTSYSTAGTDVTDTAALCGVANGSGVNGRFDTTIDLSAYGGQTVNVLVGRLATDGSVSHFLTITGVAVPAGSGGGSGSTTPDTPVDPPVDTTGMNAAVLNPINGVFLSDCQATAGNPISMALPAAMTSSTLAIGGWCVAAGGYNGGMYYSLDGGSTWLKPTTESYSSDNGDAILLHASAVCGISDGSATNANFTIGIDLSSYAGKTLTVTLGINYSTTSTLKVSKVATFTGVAVPAESLQHAVITLDQINGVNNTTVASATVGGTPDIALPSGCEMTSSVFSIKGWAVVNGGQQNNGIYFSTDRGATWTQGTGGSYSYDSGVESALNANAGVWGLTSYNANYARFTSTGIDLSAHAGSYVNVTVGIKQSDGSIRTLFTFVNVAVPGAAHTCSYGAYTSLGNGTHTATCTTCGAQKAATVCTANGTYTSAGNGTHTSTCSVCKGKTAAANCTPGATWSSDGANHWKTCSACNTKVASTQAAHTGTATCQSAATCTVCNKTFGSVGSHTLIKMPGTAPTCTKKGLSEGEKCSTCGTITIAQNIIEAIDHNYVNTVCTMCGASNVSACDHTYTNDCDSVCNKCNTASRVAPHNPKALGAAIAPTCTQPGYSEGYICKDCNEICVEPQEISAKGHTSVTIPGYAATCAQDGLTDGVKCSACNAILTKQVVISSVGHKEQTISGYAATCTETGLTDGKKCSVCGDVLTAQKTIAKKSHTLQTVTGYAATCTEEGLTDGVKCSVCNTFTTVQSTIAALGHTEQTLPGYAATCTTPGSTAGVKCSVCNTIITAQQTIPATDHNIQGGTCQNCGMSVCSGHKYDNRCDSTCNDPACDYVRQTINHYYTSDCDVDCDECGARRTAGDHVYSNNCDKTCNECDATRTVGAHVYSYDCDTTCNECGAKRNASHDPVGATCKDKATCSMCGIVCGTTTDAHKYDNSCDAYCNICGASRSVTHSYDYANDGLYHWKECSTCHAKKDVFAHAYINDCDATCDCGYTRKAADHVYDGACDKTCNECGSTRAIKHVYSNDCDKVCNVCGDASRKVEAHAYDNACDTTCNKCGGVRSTKHVYENACDATCNECGAKRGADHVYDNACDKTCNTCGAARETEHSFAEGVCTECGKKE